MWGFLQEEMEMEVSKGVLNSVATQGWSHDCLHDHECVKLGESWNCTLEYTIEYTHRKKQKQKVKPRVLWLVQVAKCFCQ